MILISTHIEFDILHMRSVIDFVRLFILRLVFFFCVHLFSFIEVYFILSSCSKFWEDKNGLFWYFIYYSFLSLLIFIIIHANDIGIFNHFIYTYFIFEFLRQIIQD